FREGRDKVVGIGFACCCYDFFFRSLRTTVSNILADRTTKKQYLLRHDTHICSKFSQTHLADVLPVDGNAAVAYVVETKQQLHNSRLTGAAWAYEGNLFTGTYAEIDIAEHLNVRTGRVREGHLVITDVATNTRDFAQRTQALIGWLFCFGQDFLDALG